MRSINAAVASLGLALISLGCAPVDGPATTGKVSVDSLAEVSAPAGYSAELESLVGLPDAVERGATYHLIAKIRSNGQTPLVPGEDTLVPLGKTGAAWHFDAVDIKASAEPNVYWAEFDVRAPADNQPLDLGMYHADGRSEADGYYGNRTIGRGEMIGSQQPANFYDPGPSDYFATVVSSSIPNSVAAGSTFQISVTMANIGQQPWVGADFALRNWYYPTWGVQYSPLDANVTVNPGESHTFTFNVTAPTVAGTHYMWWAMYSTTHGSFGYGAWHYVQVTGVPSAVNYTASTETYNWDTSADPGNGTSTGIHCDDCSVTVSLPAGFAFSYYGNPLATVALGSNGNISTAGANSAWSNVGFPTVGYSFIAPWWDDLVLWPSDADLRYGVTGTAPNRRFVATWTNADFYPWGSGNQNFGSMQTILVEGTNEIIFQYQNINNPGIAGGPTVGLNNGNGINATSIPASQIGSGNYAVRFTPN